MRNLIPHFIQEQYQKQSYEGHFDALTMFVDVSGFTPMTQTLMKEGTEGAEILAEILNTVFDQMVNAVYERGGFISVFAGDAFTAVFPLQRDLLPDTTFVLQVLVCGEKIQAIFRRHGIQKTRFGDFTLRVKVGISCGDVHWGIVGKEDKAYFFRGEAIDACAASEHHADKGDIIFDERVFQLIQPGTIESDLVAEGWYHLRKIRSSALRQISLPKLPRRPRLSKSIVSRFLPDAVINFKELGEFRPVVPIFISFDGISTIQELDDWTTIVLKNIKTFSGYFNHLDFGDKGGVVICGFGAPVVYEDMIDRALDFLLSLQKNLQGFRNLTNLRFRTGVTYGIAYAGIAGGQKRCEYTFYGEVVNLSARFMMKADWGEFFVSKAVVDKTTKFNFDDKGELSYKGIAEPVPTYKLIRRKSRIMQQVFTGKMIGRREELQQLQDVMSPLFEHQFTGLAYIFGEAGMGKSRLAYALQEELAKRATINWFNCPADQILRKPFNPFTTFLTRYFEQWTENTEAENKARFEEKYTTLIEQCRETKNSALPPGKIDEHVKELIRTKSIIGAQIGLFWSESLWVQLDAKGKYENTLYAIKNFFLAQSLLKPVVIELEDGHWIDSDSLALLEVLTRNVADYPIFLITTLRYNDDGSKMTFGLKGVKTLEIDLNYLSAEDVRLYAEAEFKGRISNELHALLVERTRGNPFYVQQMALYFVENTIVALQQGRWQLIAETLELPDTINAVLIARIDRLAQQVKELVKVAAVIGREFDVLLLSAVLKRDVVYQVKVVEENQIWDELQELQYIFKHALIRDTAYQMQLRARLRELHQLTAEAMESVYAEKLAERYADLAFHYEKAEIKDKAINYLQKAGDQAKERYQNQQALDFYERLLTNLKGLEDLSDLAIATLLKKGEVLNLIGEWKECQRICEEAFHLAETRSDKRLMGQAKLLAGVIFQRTGGYDNAMMYFNQALELFEVIKDREGMGHVLKEMGIVYDYQGDFDMAMKYYGKSLKISEELRDTLGIVKNTNNIGIIYYEIKGDYDAAMTWWQKSLQTSKDLGEKLERSRILNNMGECHRSQGHYEAAMAHYKKALTIHEELGDKLSIAIALGNIAHIYRAKGNYDTAMGTYNRAIIILRELSNKYFLSECLLGKADVLFLLQRYEEAQALNTEGLRIAEEISRKECMLQGNVLSAKIDFALRKDEAPCCLEDMLQQTEDDVEVATLHYELWKMTHARDHRQTALKLYRILYKTTPNIKYKIRMEELQDSRNKDK
ncbi:guanylate cyclase [Candidatus Vecturithrix granuli]|uniref:Guanylate cyclase n=1 Tax=Vecturithrix granuli TaxID=1499967 RepID=A0A081BWK8_VECG1|nr:guanylate cyclase [Candidatus Vecturithrix granuli]